MEVIMEGYEIVDEFYRKEKKWVDKNYFDIAFETCGYNEGDIIRVYRPKQRKKIMWDSDLVGWVGDEKWGEIMKPQGGRLTYNLWIPDVYGTLKGCFNKYEHAVKEAERILNEELEQEKSPEKLKMSNNTLEEIERLVNLMKEKGLEMLENSESVFDDFSFIVASAKIKRLLAEGTEQPERPKFKPLEWEKSYFGTNDKINAIKNEVYIGHVDGIDFPLFKIYKDQDYRHQIKSFIPTLLDCDSESLRKAIETAELFYNIFCKGILES
jgi:hypothetical protein